MKHKSMNEYKSFPLQNRPYTYKNTKATNIMDVLKLNMISNV